MTDSATGLGRLSSGSSDRSGSVRLTPRSDPERSPLRPRAAETAVITGVAAVSAFGRGASDLLAAALDGRTAFGPVDRFDVSGRRTGVAATLPGEPDLVDELTRAVRDAAGDAGLTARELAGCPLFLAVHGDAALARAPDGARAGLGADALAARLAMRCGLGPAPRAYTSACVAASTATADAAATIGLGRADRIVVAAGYVVESDQFALFDAGRALATDGQVRPFSADRTGLLLGDGVAAIVVESAATARTRGARVLATLPGWGRAGDAYHVVQPHPEGVGLTRAIRAALDRAGVHPGDVGYVNAHGSGTPQSDAAEARAIRAVFAGDGPPISSTKSVHGQALEASGLLELVTTVLALGAGRLPVNAGFRVPDEDCPLDVVDRPRAASPAYALSLNSAFGGAHTALLVGAA